VLLIIFLVTMPVLMRTVTLEVPRKMDTQTETVPGKSIVILYKSDGTIDLDDGDKTESMQATELAKPLRKLLDAKMGEKVVFVDFQDEVAWGDVVATMDTIRSLAADENHNEVKVALKMRDPNDPQPGTAPTP
jgi:biopolymer transport protein ExbD